MRFVDNGIPEDFARLTFEGLNVPLCELSEEEYMWVVYGIKDYTPKTRKGIRQVSLPTEKSRPAYYDDSIDILDLSVRAEHCLQRAGVETIEQLCEMTEWEVVKLRNMGAKSVKEVKEKLGKLGYKLKDNPIDD